jgi:hypothetical protein
MGAVEPGIESLLADFTHELDYFAYTRDQLQPVMEPLLEALERLAVDTRDLIARGEAHYLRQSYFEQLSLVRPMLDEWLRVRGSGERLQAMAAALSAVQQERLEALLLRDALISASRERFDAMQAALQQRLAAVAGLLEG